MGGIVTNILGGAVVDKVTDAFSKIVNLFHVPPEVALQHQERLEEIRRDTERSVNEAYTREIEAASANIRAEMQSGDKFVMWARPTFLYCVNIILLYNYVVSPLLHHATHLELPEPLLWLFGSGFLGYTGARTWEKLKVNGGTMSLGLNNLGRNDAN